MALFGKKNTHKTIGPASDNDALPTGTDAFASGASGASGNQNNVSEEELYESASSRRKRGRASKSLARGLKGGSVVGLNIGNESIKAVELRGKGIDVAVTAIGTIPTPPESVSNGVVLSPVALTSAIRDLMAQSGIKSRNVISSVAGSGALVVRVLEMPRMSDADLAENMNTDLERYVPFPPAEVVKDFRALRELPSDPDAPNMEVLLAAAQNEVIDQHLQVLTDAKVQPQAIDVEPLAGARSVLFDPARDNNGAAPFVDYSEATALVNIGATGTEISVLRGDILVFTRTVPVGGNALTQALADTLGLAWPDAEKLKFDMGDALPPHRNATPANTEDWSEFGEPEEEPVAAVSSAPTATSQVHDPDPFDSGFFDAGPRNEDPQERHLQKQGGEQPGPEAFDLSRFNFSDEDEVEVDERIPTAHPEDHPEVNEMRVSKPVTTASLPSASDSDDFSKLPSITDEASSPVITLATDPVTFPAAAVSQTPLPNIPVLNDESEQNLPSVIDFPLTAENDLPAVAPSGQMYGMNSVEDPSLPSFPTLPVIMAPGEEGVVQDDISNLPSIADVEAGSPPTLQTNAGDFGAGMAAPSGPAAPGGSTTPIEATAPTESVFDFSTSLEPVAGTTSAPGVPDDAFDLAFADMIAPAAGAGSSASGGAGTATGVPGATTSTATPGAVPSPYEIVPSSVSASSDFDLDQFVAPASSDDASGFSMEDFGLGLSGEGTVGPVQVYEVLQPRLSELVGEIRRSLEYYSSRYPDTIVRRVVLIGGGSRMANIDAMLTQELGVPTLVDNPLSRLPLHVNNLPPQFVETYGSTFAVAVGLAMRDLVA